MIMKAVMILKEGATSIIGADSEKATGCEVALIIKGIIENLTGVREEDSRYLRDKIEEYRHHEYAAEVLTTIGRYFYQFFPEEERQELDRTLRNESIYTNMVLSEAKSKLADHNLDEAEQLILGILPKEDVSTSTDTSEFYDFRNPLEWAYFIGNKRPTKELRYYPVSYNEAFMTYAYILVEKGDYENAMRIIDIGLKRNPYYVDLMFEKAQIYRVQGQHEESFAISRECFDVSYTRASIARCYRDFGYYFVEKENWDAAACCYLLSDQWYPSVHAKSELYAIIDRTKRIIDVEYYRANANTILHANDIPSCPSESWIQIAVYMAGRRESENDIQDAKFYYNAAYELTGDEEFRDKIRQLNDKLQ